MRYHLAALSLASAIGLTGFEASVAYGNPKVIQLAQAEQEGTLTDRVNAYLEQSQQALNEKNYDLAIEIAQQALDVLRQAENSENVASQTLAAGALNKIGFAFYQQENYVSALNAFQEALAIYQEVNNLLGQADILWEIAEVYEAQQDYERSRENFGRSSELYDELNNRYGVGNALWRIGFTYYQQENYALALRLLQGSLTIYQETNNRLEQANMLWEIAEVYDAQQDYDQSRASYQRSLEVYSELEKRDSVGYAFNRIGLTYYWQENYDFALDFFRQALVVHQEVQNQSEEITVLSNIAGTYRQQNQYQNSLKFYEQALGIAQQLGDEQRAATIEISLLDTYLYKNSYEFDQNEYGLALSSADQALALAKKLERTPDEFDALLRLASAFQSEGHVHKNDELFDDAMSSFNQALESVQAAFSLAQVLDEPRYKADALKWFLITHNSLSNVLLDYAYNLLQKRDFDGSQSIALLAIESAKHSIQFGQDALAIAKQLDDEQLTQRIYGLLNLAHSNHSSGHTWMAYVYSAQKNFEKELAARQNALSAAQAGLPSAVESGDSALIARSQSKISANYDNVSSSLETLGRYQESIDTARFAFEFAEPINARAQTLSALRSLAGNYNDLNESLLEQGDYATALANTKQRLVYAEQMLALAEQDIQSENEPFIDDIGQWAFVISEEERTIWIRRALSELWLTFQDFAWIFYEENDISASIEYSRKALAVAERLNEPELEHAPLTKISSSYEKIGDYEQALMTESRILDLAESTNDTSKKISAHIGFGYLYSTLGRYPEAIEAYQNAIKTAQSENIKSQEATALNNTAIIYQQQGKYSAALDIYNQNLNIARQLRVKLESANGPESFREFCFLSAFNDARSLSPEGTKVENSGISAILYEESQEGERQGCIEDTWNSEHTALNNIAVVYDAQGRYQEALELHQEALAISTAFEDEQDRATTLGNIGSVYLEQGSYQEAIQAFEEALSIHKLFVNNPKIATALNNLATTYSNQGQNLKALDAYQEALKITQEFKLKTVEPITLGNIGSIYRTQGNYEGSQQYFAQALAIAEDIGLVSIQASQLKHIGVLSADLGNYAESLNYLERSLDIYQKIETRPLESAVLLDIGQVKQYQGEFAQALSFQEQALKIAQEIDDVDNVAVALSNLGATYTRLGQYDKASSLFEKALATFTDIGNVNEKANVLNYLGQVAEYKGNYEEALASYNQALGIYQQIGNVKGETTSLMNIGFAQSKLGNLSAAEKALESALKIQRDVQARAQEGEILRGLALVQQTKNDSEDAAELLQQSLALHRELGDRSGAAKALGDLGKLYANQDQPALATVFLKQAVNTYESIRKENRILNQDLQSSYTETVADTYRQLADVLLTQGRIPEAQRVLDLLKIEELREFTSQTRATWKDDGIEYSNLEQPVINAHGDLIAFGQSLHDCKQTSCNQLERLFGQQDQLLEEYNHQVNTFNATVRDNRHDDSHFQDPTNLLDQDARKLLATHPNSVLIYPFVTDKKLWLLYASQGSLGSIQIDVSQADLSAKVQQFGELLKTGQNLDLLQTTSQQLYDWLITPIETALQDNEIQHLIFVNDRVTRYIPMAALYDGSHYLIENYTVSSILSTRMAYPEAQLGAVSTSQVLGLGVAKPIAGFNPLPAVEQELDSIIRTDNTDAQGIYPGQIHLDEDFTLEQLKKNVYSHRVLHIATHAEFVPGNAGDSYIMLGDGKRLTGLEIDNMGDRLENLHMVVLSACQTALGGEAGDGTEIAGMSAYFLEAGRAESVLASLWAVDDESTSLLMQRFYEFLATGELTKAEALQQAQLSLLYNQDVETRLEAVQRASVGVSARESWPPAANTSIAHPYHWAPFILIGNAL